MLAKQIAYLLQLCLSLNRKITIVTAPSGAGKTTLRNHLLKTVPDLEFSVSCTSRNQRNGEMNGHDYWFISPRLFREKIDANEFLEYEEVYPDKFYGTPFSEIKTIIEKNYHNALLDLDVKGAARIKQLLPDVTKVIFITPPSLQVLEERIMARKDTQIADMKTRLAKAPEEIAFGREMAGKGIFDACLVNGNLEKAQCTITNLTKAFLKQEIGTRVFA